MGRSPDSPATEKQLWRLNKEGRLSLVGEGVPIRVDEADAAIRGTRCNGECLSDRCTDCRYAERTP